MKRRIFKIKTISTGMMMAIFTLVITSCQKTDQVPAVSALDNSSSFSESKLSRPIVPTLLKVPAGNRLSAHAYASGVQIYKCTPTVTDPTVYTWVFVAPSAILYRDPGFTTEVGTHYLGPTWETTNGSIVVGSVLQKADSPDPTAIQWLLLGAISNAGNGLFSDVTYIQRVNTAGGKTPVTDADAAHAGLQDSIPYTAEYYFYTAQ